MWFKIREDKCEVSLYEWYIFCSHFIFLFIQLISFLLSPLPVAFCLKLNLFFLHLPEAVFSFLLQLLLISNLFPFPYFLNAYFLSSIPFPSYSFYLPAFLLVSPSLLLPIILLLSFLTSCTGTSKTLCSWLIDIVMRRIPTSLPPVFFATSYSPTPVFACTLTQPPQRLCSQSPRVARSIRFITHQTGLTLSTKAGPRDCNICTAGLDRCVWGTLASEVGGWWGEGGDTSCNEQMSQGPKQQAGGMPQGKRDVVRDPPLNPSLGSQEAGDEPNCLQTLLLFSPCSPVAPIYSPSWQYN